jgi:hypothetical protein
VYCRYWTGETFSQRLIRVRHCDDALNQDSLHFILDRAVSDSQIDRSKVVAFIHDMAAVNPAAVAGLKGGGYARALDLP